MNAIVLIVAALVITLGVTLPVVVVTSNPPRGGQTPTPQPSVGGTLESTPLPTAQPASVTPNLVCRDSYAWYGDATCFASGWGWSNGPINTGFSNSATVYYDGTDCETDPGSASADVTISYLAEGVSFSVATRPAFQMKRIAIYINDTVLPLDSNGQPSTSPLDYSLYINYNVDAPYDHMAFFRRRRIMQENRKLVGEIDEGVTADQIDFPGLTGEKYFIVWIRNCLSIE